MAKTTFLDFVRSQRTPLPPVTTADLAGRTVVVVGANVGLGLETAKHFARMNPGRLVLACRNQVKGAAAASEIATETGYKSPEVRLVDLGSFASVSSFVTKFEAEAGRLDILVCNAGIAQPLYECSTDGWESTIQVNHLATSLLTLLLVPSLLDTAKAHGLASRLVIVASNSHQQVDIPATVSATPRILETLSTEQYCNTKGAMRARYPLSKLLNVLFVRALAAHLDTSAPLIVTSASPGFCHSALRRNVRFPLTLIFFVMEHLIERTGEQGARVIVYGALGADAPGGGGADGMKGRYVHDCHVAEESDWVLSKEGAEAERRLWDETIDILSEADPRVRQIADEYLKQ